MTIYILHEQAIITIDRHVTETNDVFTRRVEFLIYALDQGIPVERAQTLSYAYRNKLQYTLAYHPEIEAVITRVVDAIKKPI
jgi:hypothetical protein